MSNFEHTVCGCEALNQLTSNNERSYCQCIDIKQDFGAHCWLETAAKELTGTTLETAKNIRVSAPGGQDKRIMVNMSPVRLSTNDNKQLECLNKIIKGGNEFAKHAWSNVAK